MLGHGQSAPLLGQLNAPSHPDEAKLRPCRVTASSVTAAVRQRRVAEAFHSCEVEGFMVGPGTKVDSDDHIAGVIDSDELVARARARYGLPSKVRHHRSARSVTDAGAAIVRAQVHSVD